LVKTIVDSAREIWSLHARCGGILRGRRSIRVPNSFWNTARYAIDDWRFACDAGFVRVTLRMTPVEMDRQRPTLGADGVRCACDQAPVPLHQNRLCPKVNIRVRSFFELQDAVGNDIHVAVSINAGGTSRAMAVYEKIFAIPRLELSATTISRGVVAECHE